MSNLNSTSNQTDISSNAALGAALGDGLMAGLIGGIAGSILPIIGLFTRNESLIALAVILDIVVYILTGILSGYLFYSRKIGRGFSVVAAGIIGGLLAGALSGATFGLNLSKHPQVVAAQADINVLWATFGILAGLGAGLIGALTAWIPGLFFKSDDVVYNSGSGSPAMSEKEMQQYEQVGQRFKRRMQMRLIVAAVSIALVFGCYFCRALSQ